MSSSFEIPSQVMVIIGACGNEPGGTIAPDKTSADLDVHGFETPLPLNLCKTTLPIPALMRAIFAAAKAARLLTGNTPLVDGGFNMDRVS